MTMPDKKVVMQGTAQSQRWGCAVSLYRLVKSKDCLR